MPISSIPKKIAQTVRWFANDALFAGGWRKASQLLSNPGQRILVYHGLDQGEQKRPNSRFIPVAQFESQLRFLADHAQIVSLDDYFAERVNRQKFVVALTFDDGYQNNLRYALPVLEKYSAPATFFLTAAAGYGADWLWMDFLDVATRLAPDRLVVAGTAFYKKRWRHTVFFEDASGRKLADWARYSPWQFVQAMETAFKKAGAWRHAAEWATYWQLLTPTEIRQLSASPLARIGAHGHMHQDLTVLSHEEACLELQNCKDVLEKICGTALHALAYPFGTYTRELVDFAEKIGFSQQLALDFKFSEDFGDPRLRARMCINPYISETNQWLAVEKGRY